MTTPRKSPKQSKRYTTGYTIGIDLGGTKVAAALVDANGKLMAEATRPTVPPNFNDADPRQHQEPSPADVKKHISYVIDAMAEAALECASKLEKKEAKSLIGIGLASAGPLDIAKGEITDPSNFRGWKKVPLVKLLKKACEKRGLEQQITFQNDAIAAALGEGWTGVAKGRNTYGMITVGTGIGTGMIFNGKPLQSAGMGSEWGISISHSPGFRNAEYPQDRSVEGIASGTGLVRQSQIRGWKFTSAAEIAEAARSGDKRALELFSGASEALAGLLYSLSLGLNPEIFAVSGGMLAIRDLFLPQAIELYHQSISVKYPSFKRPVKVSKLGTKAGVIGAARLPRLES